MKNRIAIYAAIAAALIIALLVVGYCSQRREAATARSEGRVATGQATAAKGAVETTDGQLKAETTNRDLEARNRQDILNAENADQAAGDAGDAGLRAICRRVQYRTDLRCVELLGPYRPDATR